jgi:dTMP kinase
MLNQPAREYILASPRFIAIEGIDCAGKTTLLNTLVPHIQERVAYHCAQLEIPSFPVEMLTPWEGAPWGSQLRDIFVSGIGDADIELMLAFAARRSLVVNKIKPFLDQHAFCVVDRYAASSFAYQVDTPASAYLWADLLRLTCNKMLPGLTLYLDVPPDVAKLRHMIRNTDMDAFETRSDDYFNQVRDRYTMAFMLLKSSARNSFYASIDATKPPEAVFSAARDIVNSYIDRMFSMEGEVIERANKFLELHSIKFPDANIPQAETRLGY